MRLVYASMIIPACYLLRDITHHEAVGVCLFLGAFFISAVESAIKIKKECV